MSTHDKFPQSTKKQNFVWHPIHLVQTIKSKNLKTFSFAARDIMIFYIIIYQIIEMKCFAYCI